MARDNELFLSKREILEVLNDFIRTANLETCTFRVVREKLENHFGTDLTTHRALIESLLDEAILARMHHSEGYELFSSVSDNVLGESVRNEIALVTKSSPKRNTRQDPFESMLITNTPRTKKRPRATASSTKGERLKRPHKSGCTGFNKPLLLSSALSDLLGGQKELSRPQVVKQIWAYVKERQLQDPSNKQNIICDEKLKAVMRKDRIGCFAMNKVLSNHLSSKD